MFTFQRFFRALVPAAVLMLTLTGFGWGDRDDDDDDVDATAMKSIQRLSDFMTKTKQFSVTIDAAYDVVQEWGQKLEFGETRQMTVRRPDRFKVATTDRDGAVSGVVFDGQQIAAFNLKDKVYATTPLSGTLDDALAHLVDDLGVRVPMASVFQGRLAKDLKTWGREVRYVEESTIAGVACDHVALHGNWEDVQLWIARGDRPLLQRMVITYHRAEAKPQFSAQLRDWNLAPDVSETVFTFTPAAGAAKIAFKLRKAVPGTVSAGDRQ
jgi:hypothetical protein